MNLKIFKYSLPFNKPFQSAKDIVTDREGLILSIQEKDVCAFGEISPLPSFSKETLSEALSEIVLHKDDLLSFVTIGDAETAYGLLNSLNLCASVEFGMDMLRHDYLAQKERQSWFQLFNTPFQEQIEINAVIGSSQNNNALNLFHKLLDAGYTTFKIKVGIDEQRELELLSLIRLERKDIKIRLDANASWSVDKAIQWSESFAEYDIEYIEQPVASIREMKEVVKHSKIKIAADESVRTYDEARQIIEEQAAHILTIKPMLFGHFNRLSVTKELADTHGIGLVLTSALESSIGIKMCSILACFYGTNFMAHGFSTDSLFSKSLLRESTVHHHKFTFSDHIGLSIDLNQVNRNLMVELST